MGSEADVRSRAVYNCKYRVMVGFAEIGMDLQVWEKEELGSPKRRQMLPIAEILATRLMCLPNVVSSS